MYGLQPYVRPNYYAWAAFDQTIGASCQARVAALPLASAPAAYANYVRAYAVYQGTSLASIVVLNTNPARTPSGRSACNIINTSRRSASQGSAGSSPAA